MSEKDKQARQLEELLAAAEERGSKMFEPLWHEAELLEFERLKHEQEQRREMMRLIDQQATDEQTDLLYKTATIYDGLGNASQAIEKYQKFLEQYAADDELAAFVRERIAALGADEQQAE